jgi:hypothetical protein
MSTATEVNLGVDRNNLDKELENIPNEILAWSRQAIVDLEASQRAENGLKLVEAQLSIAIRQNPLDFGMAKVTEETVKALITVQQIYIDAQNAVIAAKSQLAASRAVVDALEVKRSTLKYLAELTIAGYLGSTTVQPRGVAK